MPVFFGVALLVAISVVSLLLFSIWGLPVVALCVILGALYLAAARRRDASIGKIERGRRREPTGRPRAAHGTDGETANERVGQR
jgi:hypothetical protein